MTAASTGDSLAITLGVEEEFFLVDSASAAFAHNIEKQNTRQ